MRIFNIKSFFWLLLLAPLLLAGCDNDDDAAVTLSSLSITPSVAPEQLPVNVSQQFTAKGTYSDGSVQDLTTTVTWNSSDAAVATINASGQVTTLAAGTSNISASSGVTSNTVALNVTNLTLNSIAVSPTAVLFDVPLGYELQFNAQGVFSNNQTYDITPYVAWTTDPAGVLTIDKTGLAKAETVGTADVMASTGGMDSNEVSVTTVVAAEAGLIIEPQRAEPIPVNRTRQLVAILRYDGGALEDVSTRTTWSSSDTSVATVVSDSTNAAGRVTGRATGDAVITATHNESGQFESIPILVNEADLLRVTINPEYPAGLPVGSRQAFIASGFFSDDEVRTLDGPLSWSVSNSNAWLTNVSKGGTIAQVQGQFVGSVDVIFTDYFADGQPSGNTAEVALNVTLGALDSITVYPELTSGVKGTLIPYTATGDYSGTFRDITEEVIWMIDDPAIGVFGYSGGSKGELYTLAQGDAEIRAMKTDDTGKEVISDPVMLNVTESNLEGIYILPETGLAKGETKQYTANAVFVNGTSADYTDRVTWTSSVPDVATVSNLEGTKGQVTGWDVGVTTIGIIYPSASNIEEDTLDIVVSQ